MDFFGLSAYLVYPHTVNVFSVTKKSLSASPTVIEMLVYGRDDLFGHVSLTCYGVAVRSKRGVLVLTFKTYIR